MRCNHDKGLYEDVVNMRHVDKCNLCNEVVNWKKRVHIEEPSSASRLLVKAGRSSEVFDANRQPSRRKRSSY